MAIDVSGTERWSPKRSAALASPQPHQWPARQPAPKMRLQAPFLATEYWKQDRNRCWSQERRGAPRCIAPP